MRLSITIELARTPKRESRAERETHLGASTGPAPRRSLRGSTVGAVPFGFTQAEVLALPQTQADLLAHLEDPDA